ncbi:galactitol-1-phosphate 5-dehydrogenase [Vagococcus sp. BWB3-3]|uniref:Galactitol-1-phosphate 5-dehydrogenase n=1 Tax=Vagococcus allomyrinae TaxID=2794353 RepID=A0A940PEV5_9ENTE|nr:galactitol-1-phosphate 5-dehydrogenase [Vagococcus allomyrinae]MBP1042246.1 galactitol-1-phosphate 5-dehydrogenase [Vagococcus allomyrinae]
MRALKLYGKEDLRYEEADRPVVVKPLDVIIKIQAVGICGSDLSRYKKIGPYVPGMVWGHEFSGQVSQIGSQVKTIKVGDRVTGCPTLVCQDLGKEECYYCKKAEYARCESLTVIGARHPGSYAEYISLPEKNVVKIPDNVDYESAAMIEPSSVVLHGYYRMKITAGDNVVVVGCGNIGLLAIKWAKILGANQIIAIDINEEALASAIQAGATAKINSAVSEPIAEIQQLTKGLGADCVVESAGSPITSAQVYSYAKKGGAVVFLGIPYADINIERFYFEKIVRNELTVLGSWNAISAPFPGKEWEATIEALASGALEVKSMISHRLPLAEGPAIFKRITHRREENFGKVMFFPENIK